MLHGYLVSTPLIPPTENEFKGVSYTCNTAPGGISIKEVIHNILQISFREFVNSRMFFFMVMGLQKYCVSLDARSTPPIGSSPLMMTSSDGNIFRVTDHL